MIRRPFGPTNVQVPIVGIGTWNMERDDRASAIRAIQRALDAGATHVDTAELYGSGKVEELVGDAIAGRRDEVFLVTKVLPQNASRQGTIAACERSLRRLRVERVDGYLLHWEGSHPLEDTIAAFEELVSAGKIASWGVSNFDEDWLQRTLDIAGPGKIACNQVLYHLEERSIEHAVIPWCERHGVAVVGYSPFGTGDFPSRTSPGGRVLAEIAGSRNATPYQVALAFLTRGPSLFAIPKSADPDHAAQNAAAGDLVLTDDEIARIDQAFPLGPRRKGIPTA